MAEDEIVRQKCPKCGEIAMFESSGITICGACGQFGGNVIEDFEKVLDDNAAAAKQEKTDQNP